jgi:hypothetical protein
MSASTVPVVIAHDDGSYSVAIFDGCCRLVWGCEGRRCFVRVEGTHENFEVCEPDSLIYWQRPQQQ